MEADETACARERPVPARAPSWVAVPIEQHVALQALVRPASLRGVLHGWQAADEQELLIQQGESGHYKGMSASEPETCLWQVLCHSDEPYPTEIL